MAGESETESTTATVNPAQAGTTQTATADPGSGPGQDLTPPKPIIGGETAETKTDPGQVIAGAGGDKGEQKAEDKSSEEEKKPEPRAPAEYTEFTKPSGVELDETAMSEFKSFAKEQDLTQDQAQKLLEFGSSRIKAMAEAPFKVWNEMQTKWQGEVKADPEIGGTKYEESVKTAALVFVPGEANPFVKTDAQALREALNTTGAGNNPAMVKLFVKMGQLLSEPGSLTGKPVSTDRQGTLLDKFYPTMTETK
jgi:hypothetical protein